MTTIDDLLTIRNVTEVEPDMKSNKLFGYRNEGRGESAYLSADGNVKFVAVIEFLPGLGLRGKHYHKNKKEVMYILEGEMKGFYWLPDVTGEVKKVVHKKGDLITMEPGLAHAYEATLRTVAIELFPESYESDDNVYLENVVL
jgi:quercetin dioxygenase-like cupin family protein